MDEMESTGFKIDQAKFFGTTPDDELTMRQDAREFYGSNNGSPPKYVNKMSNRNSQENLHTNILNNKTNNSPMNKVGTNILRSSSVAKLHQEDNNPIIRHGSLNRNGLNDSYKPK